MSARKPVDAIAALVMVTLCLTWGAQQVAIKAIAGAVDPMMQVALRSAVAAALVWLFGRVIAREAWLPHLWRRSGLVVGLLFAAEFLCIAQGLRWTTASHMAVFLYTAPLFAAVGLHVRLIEERLGVRQWVGVGTAFTGIAITFLAGSHEGADEPALAHRLLGDTLGLCAGAAWGFTTVAVRSSKLSDAPASQTLYYQLMGAAWVLLPLALLAGKTRLPAFDAMVWGSLLFQTLAVSFASYLIWFWMLKRYLAARLSTLAFMTPLFGVLLGVWLLDETVSKGFIAGALLSLAGLLMVNIQRRADRPLPTPQLAGSAEKSR
ncbi:MULTISPECIES: DMT family transporter [unclassified Pseudomonas]|uniref:DMT family transporter n=1 Tax=unclassified Pseudomonas TaxID=196821 RepID=UPI0015AEB6F9|nr:MULTISPECIES: DMT family transporter [unclassified Pseudomonas]